MAVGKGSINRVSKAVDEKIVAPVEVKKEAAKPATPAKATPAKKTTTKKPAAKKTTPAKKTVVSKPSTQVEKVIGKKDTHYGLGSTLPTFLM